MAKIDTATIEGYNDMTAEEKLSALENFEIEDLSGEVERYKNSLTKANKEASEWKKKHNALLSEDEQKQLANEEEITRLRERNAELEKRENLAQNKSRLLALGYDEALASESAQYIVDGDLDKFFESQKKFLDNHDKAVKVDMLKATPKPPVGTGSSAITLDDFRKLSPEERHSFSEKNPEQYKEMYGG